MRLGYFLNVTHAAPVVGLERGIYARALGGPVATREFLAGPEVVTAMLVGAIDAAYLGAGPVITAVSRAPGRLRIVANANDAGAILVARTGVDIDSPADLAGRSVAFPGYGNTQDLALRAILRDVGLRATDEGGSVRLVKIRNADVATSIQRGQIDAAMLPEPWGTQLIADGDARLILESDRILGGDYPTTVLVVTDRLARDRPEVVRALVAANCTAVAAVRADPDLVADTFSEVIRGIQGRRPDRATIEASVARLRPTTRLSREGMRTLIAAAERAGYLEGAVSVGDTLAPDIDAPCPVAAQGDLAPG